MKRLPTVYHLMVPLALALLAPGGAASWPTAQGQELPPIKVDLPPRRTSTCRRAGEVSERRDVDLRPAQAHEPVPGQGRPGDAPTCSRSTSAPPSSGSATTSWRRSRRRKRRRRPRRLKAARKGAPPRRPKRRAAEGRLPPLRPAALLHGRHADDQAGSRPARRRLPDQGLEHRQAEAAGGQGGRAVRRDRDLRHQLDRRVRRLGRPHHPQEVPGRLGQGASPKGTPCCRPTRRTSSSRASPAEKVGGARIDAEKAGGGKPKK